MTAATLNRVSVRFSADGGLAACVTTDARGRLRLEMWTLTGSGPQRTMRVPAAGDAARSYALPLDRDRLLYWSWQAGQQCLSLIGPAGVLARREVPGLWAVTGAAPGHGLALGLALAPGGGTRIHRIDDDLSGAGAADEPLAVFPAGLSGPAVIAGQRVVFHTRDGAPATPVVLDPESGRLAALRLPPQIRAAVPVCAAGDTVLLGCDTGAGRALMLAVPHRPGRVEPVLGLDRLAGSVRPLALRPDGSQLAIRASHGARSRLLVHDRQDQTIRELNARPGTPEVSAAWPADGLWLAYSASDTPTGMWWAPPGSQTLQPPPGDTQVGIRAGIPARVENIPGADGPIEAVVYGDWRTAQRVVLALHGGPAEHWTLRFDPKLQALAAGAAVVAPNQRGSTGYGRRHAEAIKGAWGGPDLADVLAIGAHLVAGRGGRAGLPGLYGVSYGAFLAMLAMAGQPQRWSGCVAVAPFRSGAALYRDATPPVRALIDRLAGFAEVNDGMGPRDLVLAAARVRGRVLLVHGERDTTIPVSHSRALAAALAAVPGVELTYRELPGRGHDPVSALPDAPELAEIVRFLTHDPAASGLPSHPRGLRGSPTGDRGDHAGERVARVAKGGEQYGPGAGVRAGGAGAAARRGGPDRW